jgi:PAS domain S-box-containing protein
MTIRRRMSLLAVLAAAGIAALLALFVVTVRWLQIDGPLYARVMQGKDLLADVLPPPLSAIEPYLLVERMARAPSAEARAAPLAQLRRLRRQFEREEAIWKRDLRDPELRSALERVSAPGHAFYDVVERELVPAWDRGDAAGAAAALERAEARYLEHRAAVGALVKATGAWNARVVADARAALRRRLAVASGLALLILGAVLAIVLGTRELASRRISSAEQALADERERLRVAFTTSRDSISICRFDDGVFVTVNEGFTQLTGWPEKEALGKNALELDIWADVAQGTHFRQDVQRSGAVLNFEAVLRRRDGGTFVGLVSSQVIAAGGSRYILTYARDITDRKRAEELRERLAEAQKMEALGRLAGGVAHDFNNLLAVIKSYAAIAQDGLPPQSSVQTDIAGIALAADRGAALAGQLLGFSRKQVIGEGADATQVLREICEILPRILGARVKPSSAVPDQLGAVPLAPVQMEQVLLNLAINARDAMPEGGNLDVQATVRRVAEGEVPGLRAGSYVAIAVRDSGTGMSEEVKARVFEAFFTTKPAGSGTGLGLSTSHELVTQVGGALTVESAPGQGSTFTVWLPQSMPEVRPAPRAAGGATVLAVDDDFEVLAVVSRILTTAGYRVLEASTAAEALQIVQRERLDAVVTDVALRDGDGFQVVDALRRRQREGAVVMTSGFAQDPAKLGRYIAEGVDFLPKPFAPSSLLGSLERALARPRGARQVAL